MNRKAARHTIAKANNKGIGFSIPYNQAESFEKTGNHPGCPGTHSDRLMSIRSSKPNIIVRTRKTSANWIGVNVESTILIP